MLAEEQRAAQYRQAIDEEADRRDQVEIEVWDSFTKRVKPIPEDNPRSQNSDSSRIASFARVSATAPAALGRNFYAPATRSEKSRSKTSRFRRSSRHRWLVKPLTSS